MGKKNIEHKDVKQLSDLLGSVMLSYIMEITQYEECQRLTAEWATTV